MAKSADDARAAANKAIVAAAKKEAAKKAALKNSKIVTIQGKKYTVAEAKVLSEKLRAQQSVNPLNAKSKSPDDARKKNSKALSKMTPAELKASQAVLKNKKALEANKLKNKNTAIVNKIKGGSGMRGPINLGGSGGTFGKIK